MNKIKKNDIVYVLAGRDRGKTGKVFRVFIEKERALVEGINYVKKHTRKAQSQDQKGGIIQMESAIHISNLALLCKTCKSPARVGINILQDGTKTRYCKRCKEAF